MMEKEVMIYKGYPLVCTRCNVNFSSKNKIREHFFLKHKLKLTIEHKRVEAIYENPIEVEGERVCCESADCGVLAQEGATLCERHATEKRKSEKEAEFKLWAEEQANLLCAALEKQGWDCVRENSRLSSSIYLTFENENFEDFTVRISDHVARPTYQIVNGQADVEIGSHQDAACKNAADFILRFSPRKKEDADC